MANRAEERKFHYIYKITRNDGSGKYYIGMHSTDDLEDGYFGSGRLIARSIRKHGKEKHVKEILEFLPDRKTLKSREKELVNEEILDDPLCMNLQLGGEGGFSEEATLKGSKAGLVKIKELLANDPEWKMKYCVARSQAAKLSKRFTGKLHSEETKQKMRKPKNVGEANSQFGTCWVTNGVKPIKIKREQLDEYLMKGYSQGRI